MSDFHPRTGDFRNTVLYWLPEPKNKKNKAKLSFYEETLGEGKRQATTWRRGTREDKRTQRDSLYQPGDVLAAKLAPHLE